eukprot:scaffold675751_cov78-Prasinocladus_malaysianus.AAC.1
MCKKHKLKFKSHKLVNAGNYTIASTYNTFTMPLLTHHHLSIQGYCFKCWQCTVRYVTVAPMLSGLPTTADGTMSVLKWEAYYMRVVIALAYKTGK